MSRTAGGGQEPQALGVQQPRLRLGPGRRRAQARGRRAARSAATTGSAKRMVQMTRGRDRLGRRQGRAGRAAASSCAGRRRRGARAPTSASTRSSATTATRSGSCTASRRSASRWRARTPSTRTRTDLGRGGESRASVPRDGMRHRPAPMDPDEAERRFAEMLEKAGLPRFTSAFHDAASTARGHLGSRTHDSHRPHTGELSRSTTGSGPQSSACRTSARTTSRFT